MPPKQKVSALVPVLILSGVVVFGLIVWMLVSIPGNVKSVFGPASPALSSVQKLRLSVRLWFGQDRLTQAAGNNPQPVSFEIRQGESIRSVANSLKQAGLITDTDLLVDYLVYSGLDTRIQSGRYELRQTMTMMEIAWELLDSTPDHVVFGLLAGWRLEEAANTIGSSGLSFTKSEFEEAVHLKTESFDLSFYGHPHSLEGILAPGEYTFARITSVHDFISGLIQARTAQFTPDMLHALSDRGFTPYQALILASVVEREAIVDEEKPLIASVFYNRLAVGMRLESDPTTQYALGYNSQQNTWWTNPLSLENLRFDSPYNTYVSPGLPPAPICFPSEAALQAVAYPAETDYYFFRALCDNSGKHDFSVSFEDHVQKECR